MKCLLRLIQMLFTPTGEPLFFFKLIFFFFSSCFLVLVSLTTKLMVLVPAIAGPSMCQTSQGLL